MCRPVFLRLYLLQLRAWGFAVPDQYLPGAYRRYSGDPVALGKGEILSGRGKSPAPTSPHVT